MLYSPYKPRNIFLKEVPQELLNALVTSIKEAYEEAYQICSANFDKHQIHDLLPHYRKATIERNILQCVKRFPYARAESRPNFIKNCYHVLVRCGHVVLTVSSVKSSGQMVREAIFRKTYARDAQLHMFVEDSPIPELNKNLYAILLHKPYKKMPKVPEFMVVQFPDCSLSKYLDTPINLIRQPLLIGSKEETIAKPQISPRKIKKVGNDSE